MYVWPISDDEPGQFLMMNQSLSFDISSSTFSYAIRSVDIHNSDRKPYNSMQFLGSIVVSIPVCHTGDRGSIPRQGVFFV